MGACREARNAGFFCTRLMRCPWLSALCCDCLEIIGMGGSAIRTAVAGTVLGTAKDPGRLEENTDSTVPPFIPDTSEATSAATAGF